VAGELPGPRAGTASAGAFADLHGARRVLTSELGYVELAYQVAIREARSRRAPVRRKLRQCDGSVPFAPSECSAVNGQRLWSWETVTIPVHYPYPLGRNKLHQREASAEVR
jgi:hypothetical protein